MTAKAPALERNRSIDIAKGILILAVVVGHSGSCLTKYIFWFHMPAFFMISGFLFKECESWEVAHASLIRKIKSYAVLYLSYFTVVTLLRLTYTEASNFSLSKTLLKLIVGGRFVGVELGTFWFITCLMFAIIIFTLVQTFIKRRAFQFLILAGFYFLAHGEAFLQNHLKITFYIPWNMDVSLLAVCYAALGFYLRQWLLRVMAENHLRIMWLIMTLATASLLIALDVHGIIDYRFDMKNLIYGSLGGDLFMPAVFTLFVLLLSALVKNIGLAVVLCWFGYYSIVIMFLHFAVLEIYRHYFQYNWIVFSIIGPVVPLMFGVICGKNRLTQKLFIKG